MNKVQKIKLLKEEITKVNDEIELLWAEYRESEDCDDSHIQVRIAYVEGLEFSLEIIKR